MTTMTLSAALARHNITAADAALADHVPGQDGTVHVEREPGPPGLLAKVAVGAGPVPALGQQPLKPR